jgi:hypothetical protein
MGNFCASCCRYTGHADDCLDALTFTGVIEAVQMSVEPRSAVPRVPVWSLVCIVWGLALMGLGLVLNEPTSRLVWSVIHR